MNFLLIATIMSVEIAGKNEDRVSGATEESFGRDRRNEKGLRCLGAGLEFYGSPGRTAYRTTEFTKSNDVIWLSRNRLLGWCVVYPKMYPEKSDSTFLNDALKFS